MLVSYKRGSSFEYHFSQKMSGIVNYFRIDHDEFKICINAILTPTIAQIMNSCDSTCGMERKCTLV